MDERRPEVFDDALVPELGQALVVVDELLVGALEPVEPLPPLGLHLSPVPPEQRGEQLVTALAQARRQLLLDGVGFGHLLRRRAVEGGRPRDLAQLAAPDLQPVAQPQRRHAVDLVVRADAVEQGRVARLEPVLVPDDRRRPVLQLAFARRQIERLQPLEAVALLRHAHALAHDAVQVDEDIGAQQPVDLGLTGAVATHQPLQRGHLVGREVVHVHVGLGVEPIDHEVDERLERPPLLVGRVGPEVAVPAVGIDHAEEVLKPPVGGPRVALQVEEQVAG